MSVGNLIKCLMSAGFATVMLAGAAMAQDESGAGDTRQDRPLESIDVRNGADTADEEDLRIDFSFRGERTTKEEPDFLYLDFENAAEDNTAPSMTDSAGFTPRLTVANDIQLALDARGLSRTTRTFTPRYAGTAVSLGKRGAEHDLPAIDIALSSQFAVSGPEFAALSGTPDLLSPLDRQSMNIGLSIGYSGFRIDALLTRESGGFESGYEGINLGFGYAWSDFSTEIMIGDYSSLETGVSLAGLTDYGNFQKLELGAAYAVSERLRFSGGVRLFDYSRRLGLTGQPDRSGVLYLGTRLNF